MIVDHHDLDNLDNLSVEELKQLRDYNMMKIDEKYKLFIKKVGKNQLEITRKIKKETGIEKLKYQQELRRLDGLIQKAYQNKGEDIRRQVTPIWAKIIFKTFSKPCNKKAMD